MRARPGTQSRHLLANQILDFIRATRLPRDFHLVEIALAERMGVSRTLIHAALRLLAGQGIVAARRNHGFFLARAWDALDGETIEVPPSRDDALYRRLVRERLEGRLPERITQIALMAHCRVDRGVLLRVLSRMADEGIIARNRGHGWTFLPTIESDLALASAYDFRRTLEPAGIRLASFRPEPAQLEQLRQAHLSMLKRTETATDAQLYEIDQKFHETLAAMTGNAFWHQAIQQQNRMRRMLEYRGYGDRGRVRDWLREHLGIIKALLAGKREAASDLLAAHLDKAFRVAQRRAAGARKEQRLRAA